jgi:hypothetical protein
MDRSELAGVAVRESHTGRRLYEEYVRGCMHERTYGDIYYTCDTKFTPTCMHACGIY